MIWHVRFSTFAEKDWKSFDRYHQKVIDKAIQKVMQNPTADGYGKPLANLSGSHLHGLYKIKLKKSGIRIVYALIEVEGEMLIITQTSHTENIPYALINQLELNVESHSRTLLCTQTTHPKSGQIVQESFQERFDQQDF